MFTKGDRVLKWVTETCKHANDIILIAIVSYECEYVMRDEVWVWEMRGGMNMTVVKRTGTALSRPTVLLQSSLFSCFLYHVWVLRGVILMWEQWEVRYSFESFVYSRCNIGMRVLYVCMSASNLTIRNNFLHLSEIKFYNMWNIKLS